MNSFVEPDPSETTEERKFKTGFIVTVDCLREFRFHFLASSDTLH